MKAFGLGRWNVMSVRGTTCRNHISCRCCVYVYVFVCSKILERWGYWALEAAKYQTHEKITAGKLSSNCRQKKEQDLANELTAEEASAAGLVRDTYSDIYLSGVPMLSTLFRILGFKKSALETLLRQTSSKERPPFRVLWFPGRDSV